MNAKRRRGEACCWLWSEEQRHRVIWLLARFQLPELKIAAKFRTSFTPRVSRRCRVKPALGSTRRCQLKGSRLAAPRTCSLRTRLSLAQRIGAAEHVDLFFCRIHITHFSFFRTSGLVLQCCGVFLEKKGWGWWGGVEIEWTDWTRFRTEFPCVASLVPCRRLFISRTMTTEQIDAQCRLLRQLAGQFSNSAI